MNQEQEHNETAKSTFERALRVMERVEEFLVRRDEMNAAVHMAPVRHSPLTDAVTQAKDELWPLLTGLFKETPEKIGIAAGSPPWEVVIDPHMRLAALALTDTIGYTVVRRLDVVETGKLLGALGGAARVLASAEEQDADREAGPYAATVGTGALPGGGVVAEPVLDAEGVRVWASLDSGDHGWMYGLWLEQWAGERENVRMRFAFDALDDDQPLTVPLGSAQLRALAAQATDAADRLDAEAASAAAAATEATDEQ